MPRCECGRLAMPTYEQGPFLTQKLLGYTCSEHGFLHHSAIVYERSTMDEPKTDYVHLVHARAKDGLMIVVGVYKWKDDAFIKAKECYEAFDEVSVTRQDVQQKP